MTKEERSRLIGEYAAGVGEVLKALEGFPEDKLVAHPFAGKWSAREIVHHLADSESASALRLRKLLTEEYPIIQGYDQELYAILLRYNLRDMEPALMAFRAARENTLPILEEMGDEDWNRIGWHTDSGPYTPKRWLEIYAAHAHNHAAQIRRLREALS